MYVASECDIELHKELNVLEVLNTLCDSTNRRGKIFDNSGRLKRYVTIVKNGRPIRALDAVQTELENG